MNRFIPLLTGFLLHASALCAQDFTVFNQVIGATGLFAVEGNQQWTYTVGEVVITTLTSSGAVLTQGFHQPEFSLPVSINDPQALAWQVALYPNPTADRIRVRYTLEHGGLLEANVFDAYGRMVAAGVVLDQPSGSVVDCLDWLPGLYVVQLRDPRTNALATLRFIRL